MHLSGGALYVMALYVIVVSSGGGKYATVVLIVISDKVPIEINCARAKSNTCIFIKCVMLLRESPVLFYLNYNLFACCLCALPFDCTVSW